MGTIYNDNLSQIINFHLVLMNKNNFYDLNKGLQSIVKAIDDEYFKQSEQNNQDSFDQRYSSLIKSLSTKKWKRNQIKELITYLHEDDFMMIYQGFIGLASFKNDLFRNQHEQFEVLATGIVPKLVELIEWESHPFIQNHSINLLQRMAKNIEQHLFRVFFNSTHVPCCLFAKIIFLSPNIFKGVSKLLQILNSRSRFIDNSDGNIEFLDLIDKVFEAQSISSTTVVQLQITLEKLKTRLNSNYRQFANKYFQINRKLLSCYFQNKLFEKISQQFKKINYTQLAFIIRAIQSHYIELRAVNNYVQDLIYLPFRIKFQANHDFSIFYIKLMQIEESRRYINCYELVDQTISLFLNLIDQTDQEYQKRAVQCIKIIYNMLTTTDLNIQKTIMMKDNLFMGMQTAYKLHNIQLEKQLNKIVLFLIGSNINLAYKVIKQYSLIYHYFHHSCMSAQKQIQQIELIFTNMKDALILLQKSNPQHYKLVRKQIITCYSTINIKHPDMKFIYSFYKNLKIENNQSQVDISLTKQRIVVAHERKIPIVIDLTIDN